MAARKAAFSGQHLYLAGFITMLATGARRQRIGDLGGHTEVARALPVRHRGLALVPLAVVLLAAVGLSVHRSASAGRTLTDRAGGVSFDYPAGWGNESAQTDIHSSGGVKLWRTAVGPGTHYDVIIVEAFRQNPPVTAANLGAFTPGLQADIQQGFAQAGVVCRPARRRSPWPGCLACGSGPPGSQQMGPATRAPWCSRSTAPPRTS